jgi:hypothetical protein
VLDCPPMQQNIRPAADLIITLSSYPIDAALRAFAALCDTRVVQWMIWRH